jgi:predicted 3-demethylubiquinone-9 3-methyltransferase (glyoxalase superfamily)
VGKIATVTIELEGQEMVFLNGGPTYQLNPAFSFFVRCNSQQQIVPHNIGELISHPKAMMGMIKMDVATLEAAAHES